MFMQKYGKFAALIALVIGVLVWLGWNGAAETKTYYKTIGELNQMGPRAYGQRLRVAGDVASGSIQRVGDGVEFVLEQDKTTLKVVYTGTVPATFGDGVVAIVTGKLTSDGTVQATDMITKCPSKYESATGATPLADLVGKGASMEGKPVRVSAYVKPGSIQPATATGDRFIAAASADGSGQNIPVDYSGALPDTIKDGTQVVMGGALESGKFVATSVALQAAQ